MALIKEIHVGPERAYVCKISKQIFGEREFGSRQAARQASLNHVYSIIRQQTADGIGVGTSVRLRAKLYRKDKSPTAR